MSFKELYLFCQEKSPPVSRAHIGTKALELADKPPVKLFRATLNTELLRGFYLSATNVEHPIVKQCNGLTVIVTARGLNECWERFVVVKELMHLFDDPLESAGTSSELDELLALFTSETLTRTSRMTSEIRAFWMALACLCPENLRQDLQRQRESRLIDDETIAKQLKMPRQYVFQLFQPHFKEVIEALIAE